ncbi:myosin-related protein [Cyclospora cayetanensis]|uniref:Myosin-related protein n=1 Tax=Cyclospora cayetanensis TaxID=88456 RepID=A0A1D3D5A0_9EIME|nr:myosin-related protein [Cyclospora cayetanensis]
MPAYSDVCGTLPHYCAHPAGECRTPRNISSRPHTYRSCSGHLRFPRWEIELLDECKKENSSQNAICSDQAHHSHSLEGADPEALLSHQKGVHPRIEYVNKDSARSLIRIESLHHQLAALRETNRTLSRDITDQAQELSAVRKQYMRQTAEVARLSEQYDAVRASSDSATLELAAAKKQLSIAKAEAGLASSDRIDLLKENSHLRQEYTQAMAHIAALQQDLSRLHSVQKNFVEAADSLDRCKQQHAVDQEQILQLQEEVKALLHSRKHALLIEREVDTVRNQNAKLQSELQSARETLKSYQDIADRNCWVGVLKALEDERKRLLALEEECARIHARLECEDRIKDVRERHSQALLQLKSALSNEKTLRQELEKQSNEVVMLTAELSYAKERDTQKTEQLHFALDKAKQLETDTERRKEEIQHLEVENTKLTKELEDSAKKHLDEVAESFAEKQKLRIELDASKDCSNRLAAELQILKEAESHRIEALRRSREEIKALSSQMQELMRHAESAHESQQLQRAEFEATIATLEQHSKSQETALLRTQSVNEEAREETLHSALDVVGLCLYTYFAALLDIAREARRLETMLGSLKQELKQKESSESQMLGRIKLELQEAQQQQDLALIKKKQLRTQLLEATRALHLTRVRNEEDWAEKYAGLEAKLELVQKHHELEVGKRQKQGIEMHRQQQELANCTQLLHRESVERAEAEEAWARSIEEQVQQRVSSLEKDFAMRLAKIRKKVAERAEYKHLLDELLAAERSIMRRWREGMDLWKKAVATSLTVQ